MKQIVICPVCNREITTAKDRFQCRTCRRIFDTKTHLPDHYTPQQPQVNQSMARIIYD